MKNHSLPLFAILIASSSLHGQNVPPSSGKDPFVEKKAEPVPAPPSEPNILVCFESFSLSLTDAADIFRKKSGDREMHAQMMAMVQKDQAKQEMLLIGRGRSGEKGTTQSTVENIYPTEYEPATSLADSGPPPRETAAGKISPAADGPRGGSQLPGLISPPTPTAFETRNIGDGLEWEATLSPDFRVIDLRFSSERITFSGFNEWGEGLFKMTMPLFESQRIVTSVTAAPGQPHFVGTISRPPVSRIDPDSANRVWFAFVTVDLAKP